MPLTPAVELVSTIAPPLPASIIAGIPALTVRQTPLRLTAIISSHCSSVIDQLFSANPAIPALALITSSRPNWRTPSSTTACTPARSRTSASRATMRRSRSSTSRTVSLRSSEVAIGYGTVPSWRHTSKAMMSAPSCAIRTACERPWPRAAPLTSATLPSRRPGICVPPSAGVRGVLTGGDRDGLPGDVASLVGAQERHRVGDVDRLDPRDRDRVERLERRRRLVLRGLRRVRQEQLVGRLVLDHVGVHRGRADRVDRDAVATDLHRHRLDQPDHPPLGRDVVADAAEAGLAGHG